MVSEIADLNELHFCKPAQHRHAADNGFAVDGIQPTACMEIYFPGFRAPDPPLPLMPNVGRFQHWLRKDACFCEQFQLGQVNFAHINFGSLRFLCCMVAFREICQGRICVVVLNGETA